MEHPENSAEYAGLVVNKGVEQPSSINPYLKRGRFVRRSLTAGDYVEGILKGDPSILGQAVTLVESTLPEHIAIAQEVIKKCLYALDMTGKMKKFRGGGKLFFFHSVLPSVSFLN